MSLRLGCGTAGTAFGQQTIANSNQPKQRSQRLNSSRSRHAPTHIEQWISSISAELQILLPLEYPWLHVTKLCFLLVKYCMLLTRRSLKDSCTAVYKLHVANTMQNIAFALSTLHVAYNLSSFWYYFPNLLHNSKWQIKTTEKTICFSLDMFRLNTQSSSVEIKFTKCKHFWAYFRAFHNIL